MTVQYGTQVGCVDMRHLIPLGRKALMVAAAGSVLAACATLPTPQAARTAKPAQAYATAQSFAAAERDWPADAWWRAYGDPQLDALIGEALKGSPTLAVAEARARKAESVVAQAHSRELPQVAANASVSEQKQSYNSGIPRPFVPHGYNDYGRATLDFSWELDFWGKNRAAVAAAASDARAAQADAAEARLLLATNVAAAYADLARLYAERDVDERAVAVQTETSKLVADRVRNG